MARSLGYGSGPRLWLQFENRYVTLMEDNSVIAYWSRGRLCQGRLAQEHITYHRKPDSTVSGTHLLYGIPVSLPHSGVTHRASG